MFSSGRAVERDIVMLRLANPAAGPPYTLMHGALSGATFSPRPLANSALSSPWASLLQLCVDQLYRATWITCRNICRITVND